MKQTFLIKLSGEAMSGKLGYGLDFEYIEKIGAIGHAVEGLRVGESFKVRIGNKHYTGVVYNINNSYGALLERGNRR